MDPDRPFSPGPEAHAAGLVDRVVPRAELMPAALALAAELATKPPLALAASKYALLRAIHPQLDEDLAYELDLWARLFGTEGQREGMQAFLEKRECRVAGRSGWATDSAGFPWSTTAPAGKRKKGDVSTGR